MGGTILPPAAGGKYLVGIAGILDPRFEFALDRRTSSC